MTIKDSHDEEVKVDDYVTFNVDGESKIGLVYAVVGLGYRAKVRFYTDQFDKNLFPLIARKTLDAGQFRKIKRETK